MVLNVHRNQIFLTFYVFGSYFRTLAVIPVSDLLSRKLGPTSVSARRRKSKTPATKREREEERKRTVLFLPRHSKV